MHEAFWGVSSLKATVEGLLRGDPIALRVSRPSAQALLEAVNGIVIRHFTRQTDGGAPEWKFPEPTDLPVQPWEWDFTKKALETFQTIFAEEMREAAVYRVPDRGIFDTAKLVDAADATFPAELAYVVPEKTKQDWCAAGRCLAFNLLSASGFHVARAVEGAIEAYYQSAYGIATTDKKATLNSWGDYLKALEEAKDAKPAKGPLVPSEKVIAEIRQMKDDYRNPIAHPRIVLSEPDARMLFANGESLIIAMAQEIKAANPTVGLVTSVVAAALGGGNP